MFAASPIADADLCARFGNPWGNMLTPAFFGCDLAFIGLLLFVQAQRAGRATRKDKKKKK
jgi:hypothetical protein